MCTHILHMGHMQEWKINTIYPWIDTKIYSNTLHKCMIIIMYQEKQVSSDLSWSDHVSSICSKARKLLGMLYRRFYTHSNSDALFHLYQSLVRPHLEYASLVWSPYRIGDQGTRGRSKICSPYLQKVLGSKLSITFRIVSDSHT